MVFLLWEWVGTEKGKGMEKGKKGGGEQGNVGAKIKAGGNLVCVTLVILQSVSISIWMFLR